MNKSGKSIGLAIATGTFWMLLLRISVRGIGLVSTIILARLLLPEDFGLVAIAMSFFGLIDLISSFGFDWVLIQKQDATKSHYNTAWTFNLCFGLIACMLLVLLSFPIAYFYGDENLRPLLITVSMLFLLNGFQNIGVVEFRKDMTFDKEFRFQIIPKIISFFCTIGLAFWLRNYWALVIGSLVWKGSTTLISYFIHPYRPTITFAAWRDLFNFSKWLMVQNLMHFFNMRSPEMIIGKLISPQATGFYTISQEIALIPTSEVVASVNIAAYSGYSKVSNDADRLKAMYNGVMRSISFYLYPAGIGLASVASVLVPVFLGPKWHDTIVLLQYMSIGGLLMAINSNVGYVFISLGNPKTTSLMYLARIILFIPLLIILSVYNGVVGAAQAVLLTSIIMYISYNTLIMAKLRVTIKDLIDTQLRPIISSLAMAITVLIMKPVFVAFFNNLGIAVLLSCVCLGVFVYGLCELLLWHLTRKPEGPEEKLWVFLKKAKRIFHTLIKLDGLHDKK